MTLLGWMKRVNEINYNDLLAEWVDSFAVWKKTDYSRREDGSFDWIDWCTHGGEDFNKFMKAKLSELDENSEG